MPARHAGFAFVTALFSPLLRFSPRWLTLPPLPRGDAFIFIIFRASVRPLPAEGLIIAARWPCCRHTDANIDMLICHAAFAMLATSR